MSEKDKYMFMGNSKWKLEEITDLGEEVICDFCNEQWEDKDEQGNLLTGGMLMGSYGVCPECAKRHPIENMDAHDRKTVIPCPPNMSFWQFIMLARGGDNTIKVYTEVKDETTDSKTEETSKSLDK